MKKTNLALGVLSLGLLLTACQKPTQEIKPVPADVITASTEAQSAQSLKTAYSGTTDFVASTGILTFKTSGTIKFTGRAPGEDSRWDVPSEVKTIVINANVTVTGQFKVATGTTVTIRGVNRKTSVVFGTSERDYRGNNGGGFITFFSTGTNSKLNVENLTSLNPKGWHSRSEPLSGADMTLKNCRFIDDRGGFANNSDGNHHASLIEGCYFSTGDDVFCNYDPVNQTIRNCTINLILNTIPIQYGYEGPQNNGASTLTIKNLIIVGNIGRNKAALIQCKQNDTTRRTNVVKSTKTINIDGLYFRPTANNAANGTPIGHLIMSDDKSCAYKGTWTNVNMVIKNYYSNATSNSSISICGSTSKTTKTFFCGTPPNANQALD